MKFTKEIYKKRIRAILDKKGQADRPAILKRLLERAGGTVPRKGVGLAERE